MRRALRREDAFSLIEMLIGVSIVVLLIGVVASSLVLGFRTTEESANQANEAAWGRIVTDWFTTDVQGADATREGADACGVVTQAQLLRGFDRPDNPLPEPPPTTTTTVDPPPTTTTTVDPPPTTTTTLILVSHHVDWWLSDDGEILRAPCSVETILPPPDPGPEPEPVEPFYEVVAKDLETAAVSCSSTVCTLEWVARLSDDAPNRALEDRTYTLTVSRRVR